jgi:hypothetical protein
MMSTSELCRFDSPFAGSSFYAFDAKVALIVSDRLQLTDRLQPATYLVRG